MVWLDIETAPRDGSQFHGLIGGDAVLMVWHWKFQAFVTGWRRMSWVGCKENDHSPEVCNPTHWAFRHPPFAKLA